MRARSQVPSCGSIRKLAKVASEAVEQLRYRRVVETAYPQAFQLMRYRSDDGSEMMVWNSRDGEAPQRFSYDGREYRFKTAKEERSTILPDRADLVVTSYTRHQWLEWAKVSWEASCSRDPTYLERHPKVESFLRVAPFEHGLARVVSRHQFLAECHEWQGRLGS
jgi:hypothetical protein